MMRAMPSAMTQVKGSLNRNLLATAVRATPEAAQMPRALGDVDAAVVITDYALIAGLDPAKDALLREDADSPYANILVVREADRDTPWVKRLVAAYHRDEIRAFVRDTFHGNVVPAF